MEDVSKRNKAHDLSYEKFCRPEAGGTRAFSYNLVDLSPKENPKDSNHDLGKLYRDTTKILRKIKQTIKEVEDGRKRKIKQYYIGKTYAQTKQKIFDHMNKDTWAKKGIIDRCTRHSKNGYGKGGLVVLTAIPESRIPIQTRLARSLKKTHEDYALALEQQVINHLVFEKADTRVVNQTSNEGKRQMKDTEKTNEQPKEKEHKNADAFLIYMAFSCEGDDEHGITQTTSQEENPVCEKQNKSTRKRSPNTSPSYEKEEAICKKQSLVTSTPINEGDKVNSRKRSPNTSPSCEKEVPVIKRKNQNPDPLQSPLTFQSQGSSFQKMSQGSSFQKMPNPYKQPGCPKKLSKTTTTTKRNNSATNSGISTTAPSKRHKQNYKSSNGSATLNNTNLQLPKSQSVTVTSSSYLETSVKVSGPSDDKILHKHKTSANEKPIHSDRPKISYDKKPKNLYNSNVSHDDRSRQLDKSESSHDNISRPLDRSRMPYDEKQRHSDKPKMPHDRKPKHLNKPNMSVMSHDEKSRQLDKSKMSYDEKPILLDKSHDKTSRPSHKPKMSHDRTSRSLDKYEMTHDEIPRHSHRDKPTFSKLSDNYRQRDSDKTEENQVDLRHPGNKNKTHTMSNDKKPHPSRKTSFIEPDSMDTQGKNKELIKKSIEHQKRETHLK